MGDESEQREWKLVQHLLAYRLQLGHKTTSAVQTSSNIDKVWTLSMEGSIFNDPYFLAPNPSAKP